MARTRANWAMIVGLALGTSGAGCKSYTGVSRHHGRVYLTGQTAFFFFSSSWVKECIPHDATLRCRDLHVANWPGGAPPPTARAPRASKPPERKPIAPVTSRGPAAPAPPDPTDSQTPSIDFNVAIEPGPDLAKAVGHRVRILQPTGRTLEGTLKGYDGARLAVEGPDGQITSLWAHEVEAVIPLPPAR